jgi:hypothetical protein
VPHGQQGQEKGIEGQEATTQTGSGRQPVSLADRQKAATSALGELDVLAANALLDPDTR